MKNLKNKILQEFLNSDIKIVSQEKLEQYIEYCIYNDQKHRIKGKTAYHHILPKSLFGDYKNLKENPWNGTHLVYSDHYYAHWLLTEAIDDYDMLYAFVKMHKQDIGNGRIIKEDLIPADEFALIVEKQTKEHIILLTKEFIDKDGKVTSIAKEAGKKMTKTRNKEYLNEDGEITTSYKEGHIRMAKTRTTKVIDYKGDETSIQMNATKKAKNTILKEFIDKDGNITSIAKEAGKKCSLTKLKSGKFYDVYYKDAIMYKCIPRKDVVAISDSLLKTSQNKPLGYTQRAKISMNYRKTMHLIGLYIKETNNPLLS